MRFRSLLVLSLAFLGACEVPLAPRLDTLVELPPFSQQVMRINPSTMCPDCMYGNSMRFYTAVGVDPVVDLVVKNVSSNSPSVNASVRRIPDPDGVCKISVCVRTPWFIEVILQADAIGEADITLTLRANTERKSTFRLISSYNNGKG